jgi:hypothetical protein
MTSCVAFCGHLSAVGKLNNDKLYHLLQDIVSNAKLCYNFHNCHPECINLLLTFCGGGSWSLTARQIGSVSVAIFEVFHPMLLTAGTLQKSP